MLRPLHPRLCGKSAMAPALTEAAGQAPDFKLPYTSPETAESARQRTGIVKEKFHRTPRKGILFSDALKRDNGAWWSEEKERSSFRYRAGDTRMMNGGKTDKSDDDTMGMLKATSNNIKFAAERDDDRKIQAHPPSCSVRPTCVVPPLQKTTEPEEQSESSKRTAMERESVHRKRISESCGRQVNLERRSEGLLRRIQKLQGRQIEKHVNGQVSALVEYSQETLQLPSRRERLQQGLKAVIANSGGSVNNTDLKSEILQCEDVKNLSTAALVNLVRKLESTHGSPHRQKYVTLQHLRTVDKVENAVNSIKLPEELSSEMSRVSCTLMSNVKHLEKALDSDATESSSGGESCDELDGYDEKKPHSAPVNKRAAWKWAVDRSAVASRWTWLQAQVSDLEYRIRQQNDAYRQIRTSKGAVVLELPRELSSVNLTNAKTSTDTLNSSRLGLKGESKVNNVERRNDLALSSLLSSADAKSLSSVTTSGSVNNSRLSVPVNGFVNTTSSKNVSGNDSPENVESKVPLSNGDVDGCMEMSANDTTCTSSRTRPLKSLRKRKLLHSFGLYQVNHKAAKLSTVQCSCLAPAVPCVMCGGRINNVQNLEPDTMPLKERVALLDPSFHSVLSFDQDILLHLHFESLIKGGDWHRAAQKPKSTNATRKKGRLAATTGSDVHKRSRKLKKNAAATLTAKLKKKLNEDKRPRRKGSSLNLNKVNRTERMRKKQSRLSQMSLAMKKQRERNLSGSSGSSSKPASPVPSLGENSLGSNVDHKEHTRKSHLMQEQTRRRRGESAFDINNIVIPPSMAAASRVERIQYKEILTPKWRLVEDIIADKDEVSTPDVPKDNGLVTCKLDDEPIEELADDIFELRHDKCEQEEKKRFLGYMHTSHHTQSNIRGRPRNARSDSRADSSGANTPDPMSPFPIEHHESPMTTPPSTPAPIVEENFYNARRRTSSLTKRDRSLEDCRTVTSDIEDDDPISPWEKRTFPLSDIEVNEMLRTCSLTPLSPPPRRRSSADETSAIANTRSLPPPPPPPPPPVISESTGIQSAKAEASRPSTPLSTSSTSAVGDDPNDPEWTVSMTGEKSLRPGIVIKLAKR